MKKSTKRIPKPCKKEVEKYLKRWESLEKYVDQENSLNKLFIKIFPKNDDLNEILIKACSLNDFYSTSIFSIHPVAKHIFNLKIDKDLKNGDPELIYKISKLKIKGSKHNFYSFATKYCNRHNKNDYPIYDSFVEKVLKYYRNKYKFYDFKNDDLKDYKKFKNIIINFQKYFDIEEYDFKDIDKYLWQIGKKWFPKKYKKKKK